MKKRIKGPSVTTGKRSKTPEQRAVLVQWAYHKLNSVEGCSFRKFSKRATDNKAFWLGIPDHHKRIVLADGSCKVSQQARAVFAHAFLSKDGETMARIAALTSCMVLSLTAPTEEKAGKVAQMADDLAQGLTDTQIERCQKDALEIADGYEEMKLKRLAGNN